MSVGSVIRDDRRSEYLACGQTLTGHYYSRVWSGGDRPVVVHERKACLKHFIIDRRTGRVRYFRLSSPPPPPKRASRDTPNSYHLVIEEFNEPYFYWRYPPYGSQTFVGTFQSCFGGHGYDTPFPPTFDQELYDSCLGKLRDKVGGSSFNAGVFIGTTHQTIALIAESAAKFARAAVLARGGHFGKAAHVLTGNAKGLNGKTASNWLELQYGWMPLLQDVHDGSVFLAQQFSVPPVWKVKVRATSKKLPSRTSTTMQYEYTFRETCQITAYLKEVDVIGLSGLKDPLSVAWELLPWSFVVDWFTPIGNFLQNRALSQALTGTFVVTRTRKDLVANISAGSSVGGFDWDACPSYLHSKFTMDRAVTDTLQIPLPTMKSVSKIASLAHLKNALALVTQKLGSIERNSDFRWHLPR